MYHVVHSNSLHHQIGVLVMESVDYKKEWPGHTQGLLQDYQLLVLQEGEIRHVQYISIILYVHLRNSREGKSTSGVRNPCAPHPLNKFRHAHMC